MQRICLFISSFFLLPHLYAASAAPLKIESIEFKQKKTNIDFGEPVILPFVSANQSKVAKKINDYLYIDIVGTPAPNKAKDGIARKLTEEDDDPIAGVTSMQYKALLNNGKLLSLKTDAEFCGAYCEEYSKSYSFDATTGRYILLQDIFTEAGLEALKEKVYAARVATMKKEIKRLKVEAAKSKSKSKKPDEYAVDYEDAIFLYESCLLTDAQSHQDEMQSGDHHELDFFTIQPKNIVFTHSRCSNHASRALDELDQFKNQYSIQSLKPYLTPYAKYLLLNERVAKPVGSMGQVLYGTLGKANITMKIHRHEGYDRMFRAVYFDDVKRRPIELSGDGDNWTESNSTSKKQPQIVANWKNDVLTGEWQGDKILPFRVAP
jgi:uncharacterized small protein (DUF1192 family)